MKAKGDRVTGIILCLAEAVIFVFGALHFYEIKDKTAYTDLQEELKKEINESRKREKEISDLLSSNISTVATSNLRVQALEENSRKFAGELDIFRDQCGETIRKQLELREELSKKKTKTTIKTPSGPIQLEIMMREPQHKPLGKGVDALMPQGTKQ